MSDSLYFDDGSGDLSFDSSPNDDLILSALQFDTSDASLANGCKASAKLIKEFRKRKAEIEKALQDPSLNKSLCSDLQLELQVISQSLENLD